MSIDMNFESVQDAMDFILQPENFKKTTRQSTDIWVCRPQIGTVVHNIFTNTDYTVDIVSQFVVCSALGELSTLSFEALSYSCVFSDNSAITEEAISSMHSEDGTISWFSAKTLPSSTPVWACFVPDKYSYAFRTEKGIAVINDGSSKHGLGDFVICPDEQGEPNLTKASVCNGLIFAHSYDNAGFSDCIDQKLVHIYTEPAEQFVYRPIRCANCGELICDGYDEVRYHKVHCPGSNLQVCYCEDCFKALCATCSDCNRDFLATDLISAYISRDIRSHNNRGFICLDCLKDGFEQCSKCGSYWRKGTLSNEGICLNCKNGKNRI